MTLVGGLIGSACAHSKIQGTEIPDTDENREVLEVLKALQSAFEVRDAEQVLALVSERYFEDMGTPDPSDDYGYAELKNEVLPKSMSTAKEFYVTFQVHEVEVMEDKAHADIRFASRARLDLPAGTIWDTHQEFNRVEFRRENKQWRIVRGL